MKNLKDLEEKHQKSVRDGGELTLAENGEKFARFRLRDPFIVAVQATFGGRMCLHMHAMFGGRTWTPLTYAFGGLSHTRSAYTFGCRT